MSFVIKAAVMDGRVPQRQDIVLSLLLIIIGIQTLSLSKVWGEGRWELMACIWWEQGREVLCMHAGIIRARNSPIYFTGPLIWAALLHQITLQRDKSACSTFLNSNPESSLCVIQGHGFRLQPMLFGLTPIWLEGREIHWLINSSRHVKR